MMTWKGVRGLGVAVLALLAVSARGQQTEAAAPAQAPADAAVPAVENEPAALAPPQVTGALVHGEATTGTAPAPSLAAPAAPAAAPAPVAAPPGLEDALDKIRRAYLLREYDRVAELAREYGGQFPDNAMIGYYDRMAAARGAERVAEEEKEPVYKRLGDEPVNPRLERLLRGLPPVEPSAMQAAAEGTTATQETQVAVPAAPPVEPAAPAIDVAADLPVAPAPAPAGPVAKAKAYVTNPDNRTILGGAAAALVALIVLVAVMRRRGGGEAKAEKAPKAPKSPKGKAAIATAAAAGATDESIFDPLGGAGTDFGADDSLFAPSRSAVAPAEAPTEGRAPAAPAADRDADLDALFSSFEAPRETKQPPAPAPEPPELAPTASSSRQQEIDSLFDTSMFDTPEEEPTAAAEPPVADPREKGQSEGDADRGEPISFDIEDRTRTSVPSEDLLSIDLAPEPTPAPAGRETSEVFNIFDEPTFQVSLMDEPPAGAASPARQDSFAAPPADDGLPAFVPEQDEVEPPDQQPEHEITQVIDRPSEPGLDSLVDTKSSWDGEDTQAEVGGSNGDEAFDLPMVDEPPPLAHFHRDETVDLAPAAPEAAPAASAPAGAGDDDLYSREFGQGMNDYESENWAGAVHHLSIAAALKPDAAEVREPLREARRMRRLTETQH